MHKKVWYAPNKFESYGEEEIKAVEECLRDGWLAGFGKRSEEFEKRTSILFGKKMGLFVNSGSSAILLALAALDLPNGSEVVTPACGFATTVAPTIPVVAASSAPTKPPEIPNPPGTGPKRPAMVISKSSAIRDRCSIIPINMKRGIAIRVSRSKS